jgi:hypothetical protein
LFRIRIVSNQTTSISVEVYEYRRYLLVTIKATKKDSKLIKLSMSKTQKINNTQAKETNLPELGGKLY